MTERQTNDESPRQQRLTFFEALGITDPLAVDDDTATGLVDVGGLADQASVGHHLRLAPAGHDHDLDARAVAALFRARLRDAGVSRVPRRRLPATRANPAGLTARQLAVLILREVLRWRATEVAELLDTSVASVNSALQRARATVAAQQGEPATEEAREGPRAKGCKGRRATNRAAEGKGAGGGRTSSAT